MDVAPVRKVKTAFLFYQADQLSKIRAELGLSMGDAMTHVRNERLDCYCCIDQYQGDTHRTPRDSRRTDSRTPFFSFFISSPHAGAV
jgi:hypothetical protein